MTKRILLPLMIILFVTFANAQDLSLRSPDGNIEVRIKIGKDIKYSIFFEQKRVVKESEIGLSIKEQPNVGKKPKVANTSRRSVKEEIVSPVPVKSRRIPDIFNELQIDLEGNYSLVWRAYDNGVAYRWVTRFPGNMTVVSERADIGLESRDTVYFPEEGDFYSQNERPYIRYLSKDLKKRLASLPLVVATAAGPRIWISEADLYDYAGMWVRGNGGKGLTAVFPGIVLSEEQTKDRELVPTRRDNSIAVTRGTRELPWRVLGIAAKDIDLLDNQLVYQLSSPATEDLSWVRPGKASWDWWNDWGLTDVDLKPGINTATYKYYIDFAAKYHLEYIILDEHWTKTEDPLSVNPDLDIHEVVSYAKSRNVGVIVWVIWIPLDRRMEEILDTYQKWGVKGIKVDFMQRDDQRVVNFYERTARESAKRHLLVDFHGAHKPAGLNRRYPNVVSFEGVKGLEMSKVNDSVTPDHDLDLPFIRNIAGPMDYTPGAMDNAVKAAFKADWSHPMSLGTRAHQLAMYVVFESPLQMLADSPSKYLKEPVSMEFLGPVPTVWEETVPIDGKIGEYAVVARKALSGEWYIGGMTNWTARTADVDLSFLGDGTYDAEIFRDGDNAATVATDLSRETRQVKKGDKLTIKMAPGGGFAVRLVQTGR